MFDIKAMLSRSEKSLAAQTVELWGAFGELGAEQGASLHAPVRDIVHPGKQDHLTRSQTSKRVALQGNIIA